MAQRICISSLLFFIFSSFSLFCESRELRLNGEANAVSLASRSEYAIFQRGNKLLVLFPENSRRSVKLSLVQVDLQKMQVVRRWERTTDARAVLFPKITRAPDGGLTLFWLERIFRKGSPFYVLVVIPFSSQDATLGEESRFDYGYERSIPEIAWSSSGAVIVGRSRPRKDQHSHLRIFSLSGKSWVEATLPKTGPFAQLEPRAAHIGDWWVLAWLDNGALKVSRSSKLETWTSPQTIDPGPIGHPELVSEGDRLELAWDVYGADGVVLKSAISEDGGSHWKLNSQSLSLSGNAFACRWYRGPGEGRYWLCSYYDPRLDHDVVALATREKDKWAVKRFEKQGGMWGRSLSPQLLLADNKSEMCVLWQTRDRDLKILLNCADSEGNWWKKPRRLDHSAPRREMTAATLLYSNGHFSMIYLSYPITLGPFKKVRGDLVLEPVDVPGGQDSEKDGGPQPEDSDKQAGTGIM